MRPTAVVTGAASGIGRELVAALQHDAWVAAIDIEAGDELLPAAVQYQADVTNPGALSEIMSLIAGERGGLDWVVCAAGIIRDRVSWKMTDEEWSDVIDTNLTGAFNTVRAALPWLRKSPAGRVVFVGSINGTRGRFSQANYAASKAGLVGLARSLAIELARDGVTVNVITPGFIDTPMTRGLPREILEQAIRRTPLGRLGVPGDVAAAARFLCGENSGFITGVVLPVDGGQLLGSGT
jgi:NAD(P)-dependent dehydrogenase (short-subunit alcohol dehydrogenase family)